MIAIREGGLCCGCGAAPLSPCATSPWPTTHRHILHVPAKGVTVGAATHPAGGALQTAALDWSELIDHASGQYRDIAGRAPNRLRIVHEVFPHKLTLLADYITDSSDVTHDNPAPVAVTSLGPVYLGTDRRWRSTQLRMWTPQSWPTWAETGLSASSGLVNIGDLWHLAWTNRLPAHGQFTLRPKLHLPAGGDSFVKDGASVFSPASAWNGTGESARFRFSRVKSGDSYRKQISHFKINGVWVSLGGSPAWTLLGDAAVTISAGSSGTLVLSAEREYQAPFVIDGTTLDGTDQYVGFLELNDFDSAYSVWARDNGNGTYRLEFVPDWEGGVVLTVYVYNSSATGSPASIPLTTNSGSYSYSATISGGTSTETVTENHPLSVVSNSVAEPLLSADTFGFISPVDSGIESGAAFIAGYNTSRTTLKLGLNEGSSAEQYFADVQIATGNGSGGASGAGTLSEASPNQTGTTPADPAFPGNYTWGAATLSLNLTTFECSISGTVKFKHGGGVDTQTYSGTIPVNGYFSQSLSFAGGGFAHVFAKGAAIATMPELVLADRRDLDGNHDAWALTACQYVVAQRGVRIGWAWNATQFPLLTPWTKPGLIPGVELDRATFQWATVGGCNDSSDSCGMGGGQGFLCGICTADVFGTYWQAFDQGFDGASAPDSDFPLAHHSSWTGGAISETYLRRHKQKFEEPPSFGEDPADDRIFELELS